VQINIRFRQENVGDFDPNILGVSHGFHPFGLWCFASILSEIRVVMGIEPGNVKNKKRLLDEKQPPR
jgi:hypothetical protein